MCLIKYFPVNHFGGHEINFSLLNVNFVHIPRMFLHVRLFGAYVATVVTLELFFLFMNCKNIISFPYHLSISILGYQHNISVFLT